MGDARKRRFDVIAVWRFDRFARSTKHLLLALEEFRALGVQFVSYQENIDTTTPLGAAVFTIVAAITALWSFCPSGCGRDVRTRPPLPVQSIALPAQGRSGLHQ